MSIFEKRGRLIYVLVMLSCSIMTACTMPKPELFSREARQQQLQKSVMQAGRFPLVYYTRENEKPGDTVHVYLGGDGIPWHHLVMKSEDPGPYSPLVLHLMKQDRLPSIFLGRPCYQGLAKLSPCTNRYWTSARYSSEIVESMRTAIQLLMDRYKYKKLVLIGYSGGGALAILLARELPRTTAVVTVAGILDTDAWTTMHSYTRLRDSLNPARLPALSDDVRQIHIQGELDTNVPPQLADSYLIKQHQAVVVRYPDADHSCCWHKYWADILTMLD